MAMLFNRARCLFLADGNDRSPPAPRQERTEKFMGSEVDYFGLAALMIANHGNDARAEAVRLKEQAMLQADADAAYDWLAIEQAIGLLADQSMTARG
jgi:hypothetical protein